MNVAHVCPKTTQLIVKNLSPCKQLRLPVEPFVFNNLFVFVKIENDKRILENRRALCFSNVGKILKKISSIVPITLIPRNAVMKTLKYLAPNFNNN